MAHGDRPRRASHFLVAFLGARKTGRRGAPPVGIARKEKTQLSFRDTRSRDGVEVLPAHAVVASLGST